MNYMENLVGLSHNRWRSLAMQELEKLERGKFYHIYNRGNNKEDIFIEERNYDYFLRQYQKYITAIADTFAYCLMKNHFHLLVRIKAKTHEVSRVETREVLPGKILARPRGSFSGKPRGSLSAKPRGPFSQQFGNFFNSYAKSINKAYGRTGNLFGDRFKRKEVEGIDSLKVVVQYIHTNPQSHMFVEDFRLYPYSSYQSIARSESSFLLSDEVLSWFGGKEEFERYHLYNPDPRGLTGNFS